MDYVMFATLAMLGAGALLTLFRLVRGPSVLNRIACISTLSILLVSSIAVGSVLQGDTAYFGLMVSIALLGFVGTLTAARFAERRAYDRG